MSEGINCLCIGKEGNSTRDIIDRLKEHLTSVKLSDSKIKTDLLDGPDGMRIIFDSRKYCNQAHNYMVIPIRKELGKPVPNYLVSLSDLSAELIKELEKLEQRQLSYVVKQAVGGIFQDLVEEINPNLYRNNISKILKVRLVP